MWIWGKKMKFTANPQSNNIAVIVSFQFPEKYVCFCGSMYRKIYVDAFIKYSTPSPSYDAVE